MAKLISALDAGAYTTSLMRALVAACMASVTPDRLISTVLKYRKRIYTAASAQ